MWQDRQVRRPAVIAAVTAMMALLAGCSSAPGGPAWHDGTSGRAASAAPAALASGAPAANLAPETPPLMPGVITTTWNRAQPILSVIDPASGRTLMTRKLPANKNETWLREQFTNDFRTVYWVTGAGTLTLHRADVRGTEYVKTATWKVPGTASDKYFVVTHGKSDRIWVMYGTKAGGWRNYSLDPDNRSAALRRETNDMLLFDSVGRVTKSRLVTVAGRSWQGGIDYTSRELRAAVIESEFTCYTPVSDWMLGCLGNGDRGTVATLSMTGGSGGTVRMKVVAPASGGSADNLVVSPDGKTYLYRTKAWYSVPVDGSSKPRRAFSKLPLLPAVAIDWI